MCRRVVFQRERGSIEMERFVGGEQLSRQSAGRRRRKGEVPAFNASADGKMLACVFVRRDFSADRMKPFVAIGVIEMPVRIDQMLNRIAAQTRQSFYYARREAVMPASTRSLPSRPVSTAIFPPEPSSTLTLPRSFWTLILAMAAARRMTTTGLSTSANSRRGINQTPAVATATEPGNVAVRLGGIA